MNQIQRSMIEEEWYNHVLVVYKIFYLKDFMLEKMLEEVDP